MRILIEKLRIVQGNSGNYGVIYDRNGDLESTIRVATSHSETLTDADLDEASYVEDTNYHELYNVVFGSGPNLEVQKRNFNTICEVLGEGIADDLVIEENSRRNYSIVYERQGDKASTYQASLRLERLLSNTGIEASIIRLSNNDIVYNNQSRLCEDDEEDRARNPVTPRPKGKGKSALTTSAPKKTTTTPAPPKKTTPTPPTTPAPTPAPTPTTPPSTSTSSELEDEVDAEIKKRKRDGRIPSSATTAWVVYDISAGDKLVSINEDIPLQCASMVKPLVGLAILHRAENDPNFHYGPKTAEHMDRAIAYTAGSRNANISTDWLIDRLGGPREVQRILEENYSGIFQNTSIVEKIGANGRTYRNKASAHDYSRFLHALYHNELPNSAELRKLMAKGGKRIFSKQRTASIPRDQGIVCYNKTGTTGLLVGDMGIVVPKDENGVRRPYIMVGIIQRPGKGSFNEWMNNGGYAIGKVSSMAYKHLDGVYNFRG